MSFSTEIDTHERLDKCLLVCYCFVIMTKRHESGFSSRAKERGRLDQRDRRGIRWGRKRDRGEVEEGRTRTEVEEEGIRLEDGEEERMGKRTGEEEDGRGTVTGGVIRGLKLNPHLV